MDITWRNTDTSGRRFNFETSNLLLGELTLFGPFLSNAHYYTSQGGIRFNKNGGGWPNRMVLEKNGQTIGTIIFRLYKSPTLVLKNGKKFFLKSNLIGRNLKWVNSRKEQVVAYTDPTLKSMGRGLITTDENLTQEESEILISTGLVARSYFIHKLSMTAFFVGFTLLSLSKLISQV